MRFVATTLAISALTFSISCARAFAVDERIVDPQAMAALMIKADQALPKDQCFLYAEIVHQMTELAGQQMSSGDVHASEQGDIASHDGPDTTKPERPGSPRRQRGPAVRSPQ